MARKYPIKHPNKLAERMELSTMDIMKMPEEKIREIVSESGQSLNRRVTNIRYNKEADKRAINKLERTGGRFSVKDKNTKYKLIAEFKREKEFYHSKQGTVKGAVETSRNLERKILGGKTAKEYAKQNEIEERDAEILAMDIRHAIRKAWDRWEKNQMINNLFYKEYKEIQEIQSGFETTNDPEELMDRLDVIAHDLEKESASQLGQTLSEYRQAWGIDD